MIKTRFHPLTMFSTVQQMALLRNQHLKIYTNLKMKRSTVANNKVCPVCSKVFFQKTNHDRQVNIVHSQDLAGDFAFDELDNQHDEQEQNQTMPSMVTY